jgi:hypothetical protein
LHIAGPTVTSEFLIISSTSCEHTLVRTFSSVSQTLRTFCAQSKIVINFYQPSNTTTTTMIVETKPPLKILVFSQFTDVLNVLAISLKLNAISHLNSHRQRYCNNFDKIPRSLFFSCHLAKVRSREFVSIRSTCGFFFRCQWSQFDRSSTCYSCRASTPSIRRIASHRSSTPSMTTAQYLRLSSMLNSAIEICIFNMFILVYRR